MAYTPTEWQRGDVVTSQKLNKLEQGVADAGGGGVLIVEYTDGALNKTYSEIKTAMESGKQVWIKTETDITSDDPSLNYTDYEWQFLIGLIESNDPESAYYQVDFSRGSYVADTPNDYPHVGE